MPVIAFGMGIATLVLVLISVVVNARGESDFPREAWASYHALFQGHVIGFVRTAPIYVGSLVLRAPFALIAAVFGAGAHATYVATALPCVLAPALLAGWLASERPQRTDGSGMVNTRRLWPLDVFMFTPAAIICVAEGHPEDILGAALCVAAVLTAQRGQARAAGLLLAIAVINKSWAVVVAPLVFGLMPPDRRLAGFATAAGITAAVMVPLLAIRMTGSSAGAGLGVASKHLTLIPQLLWFFGPNSWVDEQGHVILVIVTWIVGGIWWRLRVRGAGEPPSATAALTILALVFFLRAALDPWDNGYYFVPFMLTLMAYEDGTGGFPKLSWAFAIMLVIVVPPAGPLAGLGDNGHAAVFGVWALAVIAFFGLRAFGGGRPRARRLYAAASRSGI